MGGPIVEADVVVLGAGISGLVAASVLLRQGNRSVLVVDEYDRVGGNHIDVGIGPYTFDLGSLIFQDDSPLLDHFPQLMDHYVPIDPRWSRINPQGVVTRYPISFRDDFLASGPVEMARTVVSFAGARMARKRMYSARDYAERALGRHFVKRSGLERYMERLCGSPTEDVELTFAESRMGWMRDQTRPGALAERLWLAWRSLPEPVENVQLARPRSGFATLYQPVVEDLTTRGAHFLLGQSLRRIRPVPGGLEVEAGERSISAGRVVSTIPVSRAMSLADLAAPPLPSVTLLSLFYSFDGRPRVRRPDLLQLLREPRTGSASRVYSDFYGRAARPGVLHRGGRPGPGPTCGPGGGRRRAQATPGEHGLFVGDLRWEGHHVLEHAYPVYRPRQRRPGCRWPAASSPR